MGINANAPADDFPQQAYPVIVQVRPAWDDDWLIVADLELVSAIRTVGGHTMSQAVFRHRYAGGLMQPWGLAFDAVTPSARMYGTWVRVSLVSEQGLQTVFVGRISDETREIHGSTADQASGNQFFTAYGPEDILRKIYVSRSYWLDKNEAIKELGWVPPMNRRDTHNTLVGNRTEAKIEETYFYGGEEIWNHYDYVDYVLLRFVDESATGGPVWTVGGQVAALFGMKEAIKFDTTETVASILRKLINPERGVDYMITPTDDGFELTVFTLLSKAWAAMGGGRLPPNPSMVHVALSETIDVQPAETELSGQDRYGTIRVLGERIVVCGSLAGYRAVFDSSEDSGVNWGGNNPPVGLVAHWAYNPLESSYLRGTNNLGDLAAEHDEARGAGCYRPVYQTFAAPETFSIPAPVINFQGIVFPDRDQDSQSSVRETLPWVPLLEGVDYSDEPIVPLHPESHVPDLLPPMVWLRREKDISEEEETYGAVYSPARSWTPAESLGIGVSVLKHEWGVWLSSQPNHLLALGHFDPDGDYPSEITPLYNYEFMIATIAIRSDQRLKVEGFVWGAHPEEVGTAPSDGVLEIEVPGAELWYLRPGTVVGEYPTSASRQYLSLTVNTQGMVLRNDREKLLTVLAGAQVRHMWDRARARITIKGLVPWQNLLGSIMVVKDNPDKHLDLESPITSVEWIGPSDSDQEGADPGSTIIRTGYAT